MSAINNYIAKLRQQFKEVLTGNIDEADKLNQEFNLTLDLLDCEYIQVLQYSINQIEDIANKQIEELEKKYKDCIQSRPNDQKGWQHENDENFKDLKIQRLTDENERLRSKLEQIIAPNSAIERLNDLADTEQSSATLAGLFVEALGDKNPNAEVLSSEFIGVLWQLQGIINSQKAKIDTHSEALKAHTAVQEREISLLNNVISREVGIEDAAGYLRSQNPYREGIDVLTKIEANHHAIMSVTGEGWKAAGSAVLAANKEAKTLKTDYRKKKVDAALKGKEARIKLYKERDAELKAYWEIHFNGKGSAKKEAGYMILKDEVKKILKKYPNLKDLSKARLKRLIEEGFEK